jgi:hypothetical protein
VSDTEKPPQGDLAQLKQQAEAQIDLFLRALGHPNPAELTDERGWRYFNVGSARGRALVLDAEDDVLLRVEAHIMDLPGDQELILPLMRELLEINGTEVHPGQFGIQGDAVTATLTRSLAELSIDRVVPCLYALMALADTIDDRLLQRYGGTSKERAPFDPPEQQTPERQSTPTDAPIPSQPSGRPAPAMGLFAQFKQGGSATPEPPPQPPEPPAQPPDPSLPDIGLFASFNRKK